MTTPSRPAVTLYGKSWDAGYQAGIDGQPQIPPPGVRDKLAWYSGKIEGAADRRKRRPPNDRDC